MVSSKNDYLQKSALKVKQGIISAEDLKTSIIEEYIIGTYFNFNFFFSPNNNETEFLGIERRLQTNLNDLNSMPARQQMEFEPEVKHIEIGHTPASIRESMLEHVIEIGDKFTAAVKREYPPGIIGPFSLQSVVTTDFEIIVYDVSLRVPGNPIMATTSPYTKYAYGHTFGVGRRIAMELKKSIAKNTLQYVVT